MFRFLNFRKGNRQWQRNKRGNPAYDIRRLTYPNVATNSSGSFAIPNLPSGQDYTVTPSLAGYSFNPPNLVFNDLLSNQSANFTATLLYENISGSVSGLGNTKIQIRYGPGKNQFVLTDGISGSGAYSIPNLPQNVSYTLTPISPTTPPNIFRFDPTSLVIPAGNGDKSDANFEATPQVVMSGNVSVQGKGVEGVTISAAGFSTLTSSNGNYSLWVPSGVLMTSTATHPYFTFTDVVAPVTPISNFTQNWSTAEVIVTGQVKLKNGSGLQAVQLTFNLTKGAAPLDVTTNTSGVYNLTVTAADTPNLASFTMTPTLTGYSFSPKSRTVSPSSGLVKNFTAIPNQ